MTNKLISLVIIIFILSIGHSYSEEQFLFPKEKPSSSALLPVPRRRNHYVWGIQRAILSWRPARGVVE